MDYNDDIMDRLRLYAERQKQTRSTVLGLLLSDSADEIERLRKENEDMRAIVSLQGEVVRMAQRRHEERDEAMVLIETIARDVSILSSRPANIIKFSDLVDHINEWGDAARKILDKKENTDG